MLQEIKQLFFAYRNGIVADTLRRAGMPYKMIFGLQVPQISEIAKTLKETHTPEEILTLANALWNDKGVRESRLLACYLFDPKSISAEKVEKLKTDLQTPEERDMLNFRILRHLEG